MKHWTYAKVMVKSGEVWRVWATFADYQDVEFYADQLRKQHPSWQIRVVKP